MNQKHYDYLIVGAGLSGATMARLLMDAGKKVLVVEKRDHVGGNIYTEDVSGIPVHVYGPHIFHTDDERAWAFFNEYADVYPFVNSPLAFYRGAYYHMPFNMNTFHELWGVNTPEEAKARIAEEVAREGIGEPRNLEEQALSMVGRTIYETLVRGYTEKQWGRRATELPASIIKRLPLRFEYNNNYFNDRYQGMPRGGFTPWVENLLKGAEVLLNVDYLAEKAKYDGLADEVIYTGRLDEYFGFRLGHLEWRSLRFEVEELHQRDYQGNPVVNYTDREPAYTRITEHKHFDPELDDLPTTVITKEYPDSFEEGKVPYYTINDERNAKLAEDYKRLAEQDPKVHFLGRLANYRYFDMDDTLMAAFDLAEKLLKQ
ncbi:MAG: UDP-galactopyranose mutase [Bacilli bacterium]|nr:UDP-galactopyranose mutase [Bacilli bacterium]